jgi:hypothetical protein
MPEDPAPSGAQTGASELDQQGAHGSNTGGSGTGMPGWRQTVAATVAFAALTAWFTYPQVLRLTSTPRHHDALFSIWRLSWIAHQLPRAPAHLFDANIFFPATGTLAYSDAVLLQGLLAAPLLWAGLPGVIVYNLVVLASFVFAGVGMFVLVRHLTGSAAAALVAGAIFAFAPFRIDHYFHLELLWSGWMPLTLWALHRAVESDRRKWGVWTGLFLAAQALSCIYYAVFLATLVGLAVLVLVATRAVRVTAPAIRHLALGAALCGILAAPYAIPYARNARIVGTRSVQETASYSAEPANYLASPHQNWLYGQTETGNERQLFPGLTAFALALVALCPPWSRRRLLYGAGLLFAVDLSLGFHGVSFRVLHAVVPIYHGLRVPARAGMLTLTVLAPLAGMGVARLVDRRRGAVVGAIVMGLCALLAVEYTNHSLELSPVPTRRPALAQWLAHESPTVIVELPLPRADTLPGDEAQFQYVSTFHWQTLVNGYSGTYPPTYFRLLEVMRQFPSERAIAELKARGVSVIVIHSALYKNADLSALLSQLAARADVQVVGEMPDGFNMAVVYRLSK